ncbi:MAG: carbohydrate ABC transporter permease [bacterium]
MNAASVPTTTLALAGALPWPLTAVLAVIAASIVWGVWKSRRIGYWYPLGRVFIYIALSIGAFFMALPFYWMVASSLKSFEESVAYPPTWIPMERETYAQRDGQRVRVRTLGQPRDGIAEVGFYGKPPSGDNVFKIPADSLEQVSRIRLLWENYPQTWRRPNVVSWSPRENVAPSRPDSLWSAMAYPFSAIEYHSDNVFRRVAEIWRGQPPYLLSFTRYFWVSLITGLVVTIGTFFTAALAAYAFSNMNFVGKGLFFYIVLATMMVPGQVLLIPNYIILEKLGWIDSYNALIVPWLASVFTIFLMRQFFMTIPRDLWDAAQIDGSGRFGYLWRVVVPLSKPVIITAAIFNFLSNWNSLLWPLIVTTKPEMRTLMVGLQAFNTEAGSEFHLLMAASTIAILPVVVLFFFLQRFFIQGIARSGLKS